MSDFSVAKLTGKKIIIWGIVLIIVFFTLSVVSRTVGWFGEAVQVASEEFGPREMLRKYEWFKDALAQIDKKVADINIYNSRLKNLKDSYEGISRREWDRTDKEEYNLCSAELTGVKASYNGLVSEYNSAMSKFNYRFANKGTLPAGATTPLPRQYKPYMGN